MNIPIIDPRYMDLPYWSALVSASLLPHGFVARSAIEDNWREWADQVRSLPALAPLRVPDPRWFETWQNWAFKFNEALFLVGA